MTQLFAQPYDISATGFYFESIEEYQEKAGKNLNDYGEPVEEYEIQFIDGEDIDCALFKALEIHQGTFHHFFDAVDSWSIDDKIRVIIATGECGYRFDFETQTPDEFDVDLYEYDSMKELAEQFVEEGLFGEIPENIQHYLDYEKIAYDLSMDYSETTIAGQRLIYRCS